MAYSATIKMVMEDDLPVVSYQIRDKNSAEVGKVLDPRDPNTWRAQDLTGHTAHVDIRAKGSKTVLETINLVITAPSIGEVVLTFQNADFIKTAGEYEAETVTSDGTLQQTVYDFMAISVRSRIKVTE